MPYSDSNRDYAIALYETLLRLLEKDNKVGQTEKIIQELVTYANEQAGKAEIEIISARKLDASMIRIIAKHFGNNLSIKETIDPKIVGGIIVKNKDKIFDGSIAGQLKNLQQTLE